MHLKNICVHIDYMDTTIRNLDKDVYRALKARAALSGKTIGEALNEAIQSYLAGVTPSRKREAACEN